MKFNRSCLLMPTPNANDVNDNVIEKDVTDALNYVRTQPFPNLEESLNQIDEMNTRIVKNAFAKISKKVIGIHQFDNQKEALENAKAIFTGGGNTFELVNQLYKNDILALLKKVLENGTPYLGTSAGGNICGVSMMTTNDMPIVYPPSFYTLGCLPFNINAHFIDPLPNSTHMGETRETRIKEFHVFNDTPVLGLREGSWLRVTGNAIKLEGNFTAKWFQPTRIPTEIESGSEFDS